MAPVLQLGEVNWLVVCAACCHMALVFAVMDLYFFIFYILYTFKKSGIEKSVEWSTISACPILVCFFNRGDSEDT